MRTTNDLIGEETKEEVMNREAMKETEKETSRAWEEIARAVRILSEAGELQWVRAEDHDSAELTIKFLAFEATTGAEGDEADSENEECVRKLSLLRYDIEEDGEMGTFLHGKECDALADWAYFEFAFDEETKAAV